MDKPLNTSPPRTPPTPGAANDSAFSGNLFERKPHAERLTAWLERLREGNVLAIDAPWGEGKTWFGRNWAACLQQAGHKVVFIDAFEQDCSDDPFLLLASEIADALDDGEGSVRSLRAAAVAVMEKMSPSRNRSEFGLAGVPDRLAGGNAIDEANKWMEWKLENHAHDKAAFQQFRNALATVTALEHKALVLFIDELDRCRPAFALRLIERLKHLFDVPKLLFVVLIDRAQLQQAIGCLYGLDSAAAATYLHKFINFWFTLPAREGGNRPGSEHIAACVERALSRYEFDEADSPAIFKAFFSWTAAWFNLSGREIEQAAALYAFAYPVNQHNYLLPYVITLKIKKPDLFRRLERGELVAHREALDFLKPLRARTDFVQACSYLSLLMEWHEAHIIGFSTNGELLTLRLREYDQRSGEPILWCELHQEELRDVQRQLFQSLAGRLDGMN